MIRQLLIRTLVIALTVAIQAEMFNLLSKRFEDVVRLSRRWLHRFANTGAVPGFEPAIYFSLLPFTTARFAANGFFTFGWSAAYMVELVRKTA
jgi:hypothetical protein